MAKKTERRCIATGTSGSKYPMIRFVISPDGAVVADLAEKLPGRGIWLRASRCAVSLAVKRKLFARAAHQSVTVPDKMDNQLEKALVDRVIAIIGMTRRAGLVVAGQAKVEAVLRRSHAAIRLEAYDGTVEGRRKLDRISRDVRVWNALSTVELARAFGRDRTTHAVVLRDGGKRGGSRLADRLNREFERLVGFRSNTGGAGLEKTAERCI